MKLIVTLSDMVGVGLFALMALVWIIFIIIALINLEEERKSDREEWEKKNGCRLDNMNERRRIKYGMMERSKDGKSSRD